MRAKDVAVREGEIPVVVCERRWKAWSRSPAHARPWQREVRGRIGEEKSREELALCGNPPISVGHELVVRVRAGKAICRESLRLERPRRIHYLWRGDDVSAARQLHLQQRQRHAVDVGTIRRDRGTDASKKCLIRAALAGEDRAESFPRAVVGNGRNIDLARAIAIYSIPLTRALIGGEKK